MVTKLAVISGALWTTSLVLGAMSDAAIQSITNTIIQVMASIATMSVAYFALRARMLDLKKEVVEVKQETFKQSDLITEVKQEVAVVTAVVTDKVAEATIVTKESVNGLKEELVTARVLAATATATLVERDKNEAKVEAAKVETTPATTETPSDSKGAAEQVREDVSVALHETGTKIKGKGKGKP